MLAISDQILRAILSLVARQTFSAQQVFEIVSPKSYAAKQVSAFNLCDGTLSQGEIAKKLKLDAGNFSRTVARWIELGVVFRIGSNRDEKLLHVFPLVTTAQMKKEK